jgi:HD-like signal output (HDOD) protein
MNKQTATTDTALLSPVRRAANTKGGLHSIVMEVVDMVDNPGMSVAQLGKVIASHRSLKDRVLRIANSPVYAVPGRVSSVQSAITLLGFNILRDTVTHLLVYSAMRSMVNAVVHYEEFWKHSVSCGIAASILAQRFAPEHVDDAFVAGLFHDIGILLLSQADDPDPLLFARRKGLAAMGELAHEDVGAWLAEEWQLGDHIAEAIRHHHAPGKAAVHPELAATLHIADVLCAQLDLGLLHHDTTAEFLPEAADILGIPAASLTREGLAEETAMLHNNLATAPEFHVLVERVKASLVEGLGQLPEKQRLTFALYYLEGLTFADVARVLRVTEQDVHVLHGEALSALSEILHQSI